MDVGLSSLRYSCFSWKDDGDSVRKDVGTVDEILKGHYQL